MSGNPAKTRVEVYIKKSIYYLFSLALDKVKCNKS